MEIVTFKKLRRVINVTPFVSIQSGFLKESSLDTVQFTEDKFRHRDYYEQNSETG